MSINFLIEKAENGTLTEGEVIAYCVDRERSLDQFAHDFSRKIVQNYSEKIHS